MPDQNSVDTDQTAPKVQHDQSLYFLQNSCIKKKITESTYFTEQQNKNEI